MKRKEFSIAVNCYYICISLLLVFVMAMLVLYLPSIREVDYTILHAIQGCLSTFPIAIAKFICSFGASDYWLWPRITAASVIVSHKYYLKAFIFLILTRAVIYFNGYIKNWVCRERPCGFTHPGYSFPSGHASFSVCMYGILIYLVYRYVKTDWWRILLITLLTIWTILICLSRMWLNVHFFTDIIAGGLIGLAFVNLFIMLDKFFNN